MLLFIGKTQISFFNIGGQSVKYDELQCPKCKEFIVRDFLMNSFDKIGKHATQSKMCSCGEKFQFDCVEQERKNYVYNIFQIREI